MSATGRGARRHPDNFYPTPRPTLDVLFAHLESVLPASTLPLRVLDPCVGTGNILRAAEHYYPGARHAGMDASPRAIRQCLANGAPNWVIQHADALTTAWPAADLCVCNPPFPTSRAFVETALTWIADAASSNGPRTGAFLLRLGWLSSRARAALHTRAPADVRVLSVRPRFCIVMRCAAKKRCPWRKRYEIGAKTPSKCPRCRSGVDKSESDASEYAWLLWGVGAHPGRWGILPSTQALLPP